MNGNPEDYDPEELRRMAEERRAPSYPESRPDDRDDSADPGVDGAGNGRAGRGGDDRADDAQQRPDADRGPAQGRGRPAPREPRADHHGDGTRSREPDREQPPQRGNPTRERRRPGRGNPGPGRGVAGDALRSNQLEQLFLHQSAMVAEQMTKPYLDSLPQKYAAERVIFDWLEFLVLKAGFKRAMDALRYYRTIDWITDDVEAALQDYLVGFTDEGRGAHDLDVDDHQLSLLYVARLASMS
jgi:flagellar protein FlaE